ncbi:hypothetical protein [Streptomyces sp. NPDC018031]|uniref:hypothetical protein n=1 Tax=Streptomyces sp. NPDC018031 TaxID=3365033 RepID=UPI00379BAE04
MPDMTGLTPQLLAVEAGDTGPGALLRIVIVVGLVGMALLAWLLLRGYGKQD